MNKALLLAAAMFSSASASALAADMPVRPLPAPAVFTWTGFYVGLNAGYAWSTQPLNVGVPAFSDINAAATAIAVAAGTGSANDNGFTGGAQLGYNWQFGSSVAGLEGDFNYLGLSRGRDQAPVFSGAFNGRAFESVKSDWLGTIRGRFGFAIDRALIYATAGIAFTDAKFGRALDWSFLDGCPIGPSGLNQCHVGSTKWNTGWALGGGVEYALAGNWSAKAEYLYVDFGRESFQTINANKPAQTLLHSARLQEQILRVGVNYRFY